MKAVVGEVCPASGEWMDLGVVGASTWDGSAARGREKRRDLGVQGAWRVMLGLAKALWISYSLVERVDVISARDMLAALREAFAEADGLFMCAAVCDWRPRRKLAGKWRKKDGGTQSVALDLVRNPDILASLAKKKGPRLVVGFALETEYGMARARAKLKRKGADYIVLNDPSALSGTRASVKILGSDGSSLGLDDRTKDQIARVLVGLSRT
jgi:phosphopantothenoylcysteine decarboxylase/phosphopantothenate--cysteine ligase